MLSRAHLAWAILILSAGCTPNKPYQVSPPSLRNDGPSSQVEPKSTPSPDPAGTGAKVGTASAKASGKAPSKPPTLVPDTPSDQFHWAKTREEALATAKKINGYAVLRFEADWAVQAQIMKREAFHDDRVARAMAKAVIVPINVDGDLGAKLQEQYKVELIPHMEFLHPNGKSFGGILGYQDVDRLLGELKRMDKQRKG